MAFEKDNGVLSDAEGGERVAREQLKKAHIQDANAAKAIPDAHDPTTTTSEATSESVEGRGRLKKKRSHDEVEAETAQEEAASAPTKQHTRKRSRDSTADEEALNNGQRKSLETERNGEEPTHTHAEANGNAKSPRSGTPEVNDEPAVELLTSPKTKRSRLQSTNDDAANPGQAGADISSDTKEESATTKLRPGSAFANTSSASPFGALAGSKSPSAEPQTSASAFSSSAFGALAGSSSSGFGTLGKTAGGPGLGGGFASGAKSPLNTKENDAPPATGGFGRAQKSAFSAAGGSTSAFGAGSSGFSSLGGASSGGFGTSLGGGLGGSGFGSLGGGGLSSFASGKPTAPFGGSAKGAKPFGAKTDDDEDDEGNDDDDDKSGMKSPLSQEEEKQDERFYEQSIDTGEEGEVTEFSCRSKLYNWAAVDGGKKEWRERGIGVLKLNVKYPALEDEDGKLTARLLIRADGSHRIVLNTPIKKEIKFGDVSGEKPQGGYIFFSGTIDDKPDLALLQLKVKQANALELYDKIKVLKDGM